MNIQNITPFKPYSHNFAKKVNFTSDISTPEEYMRQRFEIDGQNRCNDFIREAIKIQKAGDEITKKSKLIYLVSQTMLKQYQKATQKRKKNSFPDKDVEIGTKNITFDTNERKMLWIENKQVIRTTGYIIDENNGDAIVDYIEIGNPDNSIDIYQYDKNGELIGYAGGFRKGKIQETSQELYSFDNGNVTSYTKNTKTLNDGPRSCSDKIFKMSDKQMIILNEHLRQPDGCMKYKESFVFHKTNTRVKKGKKFRSVNNSVMEYSNDTTVLPNGIKISKTFYSTKKK